MAGYTRQSTFSDGDTITAAIFNNEYNAIANAFHNQTGHKHDGTAAEGPVIGVIGDAGVVTPLNKVLIDTTNDHIEFWIDDSSSSVQQVYIGNGVIAPVTDSDIDLGTNALRFKDAYIDTITTTSNVSVGGNLTVTGTTTLNGGTLTLGDAASDNVVFGADVDSSIIPDDDDTYDLGSTTQEWRNLFIDGTANIDSLVLGSGVTVTSILDEDGLTSDSASALATQQSIKAYVDAQVTAQDLDFQGDSGGALSIDLDSETLDIAGGTGIDTAGSGNTLTVAIDSTVATLTGSQTLTNKTIDVDNNTLSNIEVDNFKSGVLDTDISSVAGTDTTLASAKAIKTYVDAQVTAQDLDATTDSGTVAIDLDSETLTIAGGEGIDTSGSGNTITITGELATETNAGVATFDGTDFTVSSGDVTLNAERIQDITGAMFSGNTETGIAITYDDSDGTIDAVVSLSPFDTDNLSEGSSNLYYTNARVRSHITGSDLDMGGNKVLFGNLYSNESDLPSASTYHGMFAHVHATGKGYFAHGGQWHKLLDESSSDTGDLTEGSNLYFTNARADARADARIAASSTDDLSEGSSNLYHTVERVQDVVGGMVSSNTENGISVTYDDSDGTLDFDVNDPTITLAGDVTGSATMTNLGNVSITTTVAANSVALGTDTTGDYVDSLVAGTGVTLTNNSGESATPTVAIGQAVETNSSVTFGSVTTTGNTTVGGNLVVNGTTTTLNTATLDVEDNNITLNKGSGDTSGSADGAGITIQDAVNSSTDATIAWSAANDNFVFSHEVVAPSLDISGNVDIDGTLETDALTINGTASVPFESADHSKLDGIEANATADQTASEIRALVEAATDSNVFTDADHTKLNNIEANATGDQTASEIKALYEGNSDTNAFTDADESKLDGIEANATADQTDEEIQDIVGGMLTGNTETGITVTYQDSDGTIDFVVASQTDENFTTADHAKLDGIEAGATGDQTAAEIRALVESASDSNVFTDADHTKLNGIEASADVTDSANVGSALTGFSTGTDADSADLIAYYDVSANAWEKGTISDVALQGDKGQKGEGGVLGSKGQKGEVGQKGQKGEEGADGSKGQKGEVGATGSKGQKGEVGNTGSNGDKGQKGQKGEVGATGNAGGDGDKGQKGEVGASGSNGAKGQKGEVGATGSKGQKGEAGVDGAASDGTKGQKGQKGEVGATGSKGQKGEVGNTGAAGNDGTDGDKGQKGEVGAAGSNGSNGSKGQKGEVGATGNNGSNGSDGDKGQKGEAGTNGSNGSNGSKGEKGQKGQTGNTGAAGNDGNDGAKGQKDEKGQKGEVGATGSKGQKGEVGATGSKGQKGEKGQKGVKGQEGNFGGQTFAYDFDTGTSDADPGNGELRLNNGTVSSASILYIDDQDSGGTDIQSYLRTIDDSDSTIKGHVRISNKLDASDFALFTISGSITEASGYFKVPVAYVSGSASSFSNGEDLIVTFARTGDQGDKGQKGEVGSTGSTGSKGQKGEVGATGQKGQKGEVGSTGSTGAKGEKGQKGQTGATGGDGNDGNDGSKGQKGEVGAAGNNGTNGSKGQKGEVGAAGNNGTNGSDGDKGQKGQAGSNGTNGTNGSKGQKGQAGTNGSDGNDGTNGDKGQKGEAGSNGTNGDKGQKGQAGSNGTNGTNGSKGQKGEAGTNGTNGTNGTDGSKGQKGQAGTNGSNGTDGDKGQKGQAGTNGNNGTNGTDGDKGQKGEVGQKGQKGQAGTNGTDGTDGDKGQKGEVGQKGQKGEVGATGVGQKGQKGQKGQTGATGVGQKGQKGETGAKGQKGEVGPTGTGQKGQKGATGDKGQKGQTGTGSKGQKGEVGSKGQKGEVGTGQKGQKGEAGGFTTSSNAQVNSLGINTAGSGTAGEIRATNNITAYYSDARLKDFESTIPNALDKVLALSGYYFRENELAKELGYENDKRQVGVSAQEVQDVLPEVVTEAPIDEKYLTVWYDKLVPLLIEAIKELAEDSHPPKCLQDMEGFEDIQRRLEDLENK